MKKNTMYNTLPEGYVPPSRIDPKHSLQMFSQGSVTEITLDGKTFQVLDPARMEAMAKLVDRHNERFFEVNQSIKQLKNTIRELTTKLESTREDVRKLQERLKENGNFL